MTYEEKKQLALNYIKNSDEENEKYTIFYRIYSFSTENLTEFFNKKLLNDKKVLITGSSADQIIVSQLFDSKKITHFDINPFCKYMYDLKMAALKELNIDSFINYFYFKYKNKNSLDYKKYELIRKNLTGESLDFWDSLYNTYTPLKIRKSIFMDTDEEENRNRYKCLIPYLFEDNYNKLKTKELIPVEFVECSILDLPNYIKDNYDLVYFSNILNRIETAELYKKNYVKKVYKFMSQMIKHTNIDGKILLNYFYSVPEVEFYKNSGTGKEVRIKYPIDILNQKENISYKEISSVADYEKDTVLIYTKKR